MFRQLTIEEVIQLVRSTPEQATFDWKTDFTQPTDDNSAGEIIKDIAAIANASASSYGYIVYGVNPKHPDVVLGISKPYDDARLQQLVGSKINPAVNFIYYEVSAGPKHVAIIQIVPSRLRPHIICTDIGRVRKGQIPIRRGSSTDGVTINDLFEFFYGPSSGYFPQVIQRLQLDVAQQQAWNEKMRLLQQETDRAERDMEMITGVRLR